MIFFKHFAKLYCEKRRRKSFVEMFLKSIWLSHIHHTVRGGMSQRGRSCRGWQINSLLAWPQQSCDMVVPHNTVPHSAYWFCDVVLLSSNGSALNSWPVWNRCRGEGPLKERNRGEEGSYLARAVCLWLISTLLYDIHPYFLWQLTKIYMSRVDIFYSAETTWKRQLTLRNSYDFPYAISFSCAGFVFLFKALFDFSHWLCLFWFGVQSLGWHCRIYWCFFEAGGSLGPPGKRSFWV